MSPTAILPGGRRPFAPSVQLARRVDPVLKLLCHPLRPLRVKDSRTCAASDMCHMRRRIHVCQRLPNLRRVRKPAPAKRESGSEETYTSVRRDLH